jgi:hypothetical protein
MVASVSDDAKTAIFTGELARAHRYGQQNRVLCQYLVAKDSTDDMVWRAIKRKAETQSMLMSTSKQDAEDHGNALGATLTKLPSAYWKLIVGDTNWGKIQANIDVDAKNALELFETKYKDQYDDLGFVNYIPAYLAMVADNGNKVCGATKSGYFFDQDKTGEQKYFVSYDDAQKKKFKKFVDNINSMPTKYQCQRKELCVRSPAVRAYFMKKNKKYAAKHSGINSQPRFDII